MNGSSIWRLPSAKLQTSENQTNGIWQAAPAKLEEWCTPPDRLFKYQLQLPSEEEMRQYLLESATAEDWAEYREEQEKEQNKEK